MTCANPHGCVCIVVDKVYVVGGSDSQMSLVSVEIFNVVTGSWSSGPNLGIPRANMGVAVAHGRLFAVGGFSGKAFLNDMEYLNVDGDQWCAYWPADAAVRDSGGPLLQSDMSAVQ